MRRSWPDHQRFVIDPISAPTTKTLLTTNH
jgi:hypothetical protein